MKRLVTLNIQIYSTEEIMHRFEEFFPLFYEEWSVGKEDYQFHIELLKHPNGMLGLPRFYVAEVNNELVGCYALLLNDINSRQDIFPWFAYLYVKQQFRNIGIATMLLNHSEEVAQSLNFPSLYLESNLSGFYERFGYLAIGETSDPFGEKATIYQKTFEKK